MVLVVIKKLEGFIEKTLEVKQRKQIINKGGKPPENEVLTQKQDEHDIYLKNIREAKKKIKKMKDELEDDENFKRMVDSENSAKEQYRRLQQLIDDNM